MPVGHVTFPALEELRARTLALSPNAGAGERGTILALLGSIERAELLIRRIDTERRSVNRQSVVARAAAQRSQMEQRPRDEGKLSPSRPNSAQRHGSRIARRRGSRPPTPSPKRFSR